jgi:branched-chain amino acid transport system ATP-binding protein
VSGGLELAGVEAFYGKSHVLSDVGLTVAPGEVVFLLGRNGAGKTTTMRVAAGLLEPRSGTVTIDSYDVAALAPHEIVRHGVALVPEDRRLFANMTVAENLDVAQRHARRSDDAWDRDAILRVLPVVGRYLDRRASELSGGEQQMVAIARALMSNPTILLLDEPMEGLAPLIVRALEEHIESLRATGVGVLVSETHLTRALRPGARSYVIDRGRIVFDGTSRELAEERGHVEHYLTV